MLKDYISEISKNIQGWMSLKTSRNKIYNSANSQLFKLSRSKIELFDQYSCCFYLDCKTTSKQTEIFLDADWQIGYKRQMEIYLWLFKNNGFKVLQRGYFIYCNGKRDAGSSGTNLAFEVTVLPYDGDLSWIESTLYKIKECLSSEKFPLRSRLASFVNIVTKQPKRYLFFSIVKAE